MRVFYHIFKLFVYTLLLALLMMSLGKILFFLFQSDYAELSFGEIFQALFKGLRLDLSSAAYLLGVPMFLLAFSFALRTKWLFHIARFILFFNIILYQCIVIGESLLYREWQSKLNVQALLHFLNPSEVFKTASWGMSILFFASVIALSFAYIFLANKIFKWDENLGSLDLKRRLAGAGLGFFVSMSSIVIMARGGLQEIPISSSDCYFSQKTMLNDAANNPFWSLCHNFVEYQYHLKENPFKVMEDAEANSIVADLFAVEKDTTEIILNTAKPNVVFLILESWSSNCVRSFGGDNFAPFMDSLSQQGLRFTNLYASAYVSDQGIPAVLSAFPADARISIINYPQKTLHLPCVNKDLEKAGYNTAFYFGGDLNYGNIKAYLMTEKFNKISEQKDIDPNLPSGNLGVHDHLMYKQFLNALDKASAPFFYSWFTLSSHHPYDPPITFENLVDHKENPYVNCLKFSDAQLRKFFDEAKTKPWYKNTLFVLTPDHSHASHKGYDMGHCNYHKLPVTFFGEVIKAEYKGKEMSGVFAQTDIVPTLLKQLGLKADHYKYGKNMLNKYSKHFAFYPYQYGGGFVDETGAVCFKVNNGGDAVLEKKEGFDEQRLMKLGKAMQQAIYTDYMNY
jgi:phosphoglycerol transferase MdoB-like AlkP superfamily enzyme